MWASVTAACLGCGAHCRGEAHRLLSAGQAALGRCVTRQEGCVIPRAPHVVAPRAGLDTARAQVTVSYMLPYGAKRYHALRAHGHEADKHFGRIIPKAPARREAQRDVAARIFDVGDIRGSGSAVGMSGAPTME